MRQSLNIIRILLNPKIIRTPIKVLNELRVRGKERLPQPVSGELRKGFGAWHTFQFIKRWFDGELLSKHNGKWVLNSFLPPFPSPSFDRMFLNLLTGRRLSPVSAFLGVTSECSYRCWHCSFKNRKTGNLSKETWLSAIQQLHKLGASIIGFTGGEPLTRDDLPELIEAASQGGATTVLFTSGALLTKDIVQQLMKVGLWSLCVSLDHYDPKEHEELRGVKGAFNQSIEALKLAKQAGLYTMMGTVSTKELVDTKGYLKIYDIARDLKIDELRLVEPMPCGKIKDVGDDGLLQEHQVKVLRDFHVSTNRKGQLPKVCSFNQIESPEIFGCGAGTQHLFIDSSGEVCPCDFTPLGFGNINSESLGDIWTRMSDTMGNPRRHCFIQENHNLLKQYEVNGFPLPFEISQKICREAGKESLPDYFSFIKSQAIENKSVEE